MDVCEVELGWPFGVVNSTHDGKDGPEYEKRTPYTVRSSADGTCQSRHLATDPVPRV